MTNVEPKSITIEDFDKCIEQLLHEPEVPTVEQLLALYHVSRTCHASRRLGCYDCDLEYGGDSWIEAVIPDKVWNEISPDGEGGGVLCISCIARRLREKFPNERVPVWMCGTEPLEARAGDPGDNDFELSDLREWYPSTLPCKNVEPFI